MAKPSYNWWVAKLLPKKIAEGSPCLPFYHSHRIHGWYIYLHEWSICIVNVGKYAIHVIHGSYGIEKATTVLCLDHPSDRFHFSCCLQSIISHGPPHGYSIIQRFPTVPAAIRSLEAQSQETYSIAEEQLLECSRPQI